MFTLPSPCLAHISLYLIRTLLIRFRAHLDNPETHISRSFISHHIFKDPFSIYGNICRFQRLGSSFFGRSHSVYSCNSYILGESSVQKASQVVKNLPASAGDIRDTDWIPGSERSPGGGHGNPLQYSCLENPMDRGA